MKDVPKWLWCALVIIFVFSDPKFVKIELLIACYISIQTSTILRLRHLWLNARKWLWCALVIIFVFSDPEFVKIELLIACYISMQTSTILRLRHIDRHLELHAPKWLSCALMVIFVFSDPTLVKIKWSIVCILPVWVLYWTAAILAAILNISLPFENLAIQQAFSDSAGSIYPRSIKK